MPATNVLANLFVTLYNNEARRRDQCTILPASNLGEKVLETLVKHDYIAGFERVRDGRGDKFQVELKAKITKCGAISPRFKVSKDGYNQWEQQYLPAYNRGILLVTTSYVDGDIKGVMSHREASEKGLGGLLIGYVYGPDKHGGEGSA